MITQSVIAITLIGIVITGLIPIIGGIALLAMGKIKASSFWAGVLAYIIGIIASSIVSVIITFATTDMSAMSSASAVPEASMSTTIIVSVITGLLMALSMGVCVKSCMKTRTFNAALSCGLGFGAAHAVTAAMGLVTIYTTFASINSGAFDMMYANSVKMGIMTKETVAALKAVYTGYTPITIINVSLTNLFFAAAMAAAAVFIMRFVCSGKAFIGICSAMGTLVLCSIGSAIPNAVAAIIVTAAIGIAALIFAIRIKGDVIPPEKKAVADPFLSSVENAKNDE